MEQVKIPKALLKGQFTFLDDGQLKVISYKIKELYFKNRVEFTCKDMVTADLVKKHEALMELMRYQMMERMRLI